MSAEEENKAVVRREVEELYNYTGNLDAVEEIFSPMEITGITIKRLSDGKIVEAWTNFDALGMMQQLGKIPEAAGQA
jgi:hypothetical protein